MIKALNPRAIIHETVNSEVPLNTVLGTGIYDPGACLPARRVVGLTY